MNLATGGGGGGGGMSLGPAEGRGCCYPSGPAWPKVPPAPALAPPSGRCCKGPAKQRLLLHHRRRRRSSSPELLRCKRRLAFPGGLPAQGADGAGGGGGGGSVAVARRNERERNRVKLVNLGFQTLRQHVPNGAAAKKMSKVETLRSAVDYIRALQQLLREHDGALRPGPAGPAGPRPFLPAPDPGPHALPGPGPGPSAGSPSSASVPASPRSAYSSDESGYEGGLSPEEQELLDFTSWFGSY